MMKIVLRGSKKFLTCSFTEAVLCWFVFILSSSNGANSSQQGTFFILNTTSHGSVVVQPLKGRRLGRQLTPAQFEPSRAAFFCYQIQKTIDFLLPQSSQVMCVFRCVSRSRHGYTAREQTGVLFENGCGVSVYLFLEQTR